MSLPSNPPLEFPAPLSTEPPPPEIPVENPPWSGWDVLVLAIAAVVAINVFVIIAVTVYLAIYSSSHPGEVLTPAIIQQLTFNPYVLVWGQGVAYFALIGMMVWLVRRRSQCPFWESLRWNWPTAAWPAYLLEGVALAIAVQAALRFLPVPKSLPIQRYFETAEGAYLMAAFGILIAPLVEELFFRGFLYPVLARRFAHALHRLPRGVKPTAAARAGMTISVVLTAIGFALIHGAQLAHSIAPLAVLFTVGLIITAVRALKGSLAAGLLIHVGYNVTLFTLLYIATDQFRHLERMSQ